MLSIFINEKHYGGGKKADCVVSVLGVLVDDSTKCLKMKVFSVSGPAMV